MSAFTKEQHDARVKRFLAYLRKHGLAVYLLPWEKSIGQPHLVASKTDRIKVTLTAQGGIYLTGYDGNLKDLLLKWVQRENPRYIDKSKMEDLEKLNTVCSILWLSLRSVLDEAENLQR
jgi:hypothetical protein